MKNKLYPFFKYTLLSHSKKTNSNQGFVIPVILGFGLFMLLVAIMMITRSSDDKVTASLQEQTADSLGVAEAGLNRSLQILDTENNGAFLKRNYDVFKPNSPKTYFENEVETDEWTGGATLETTVSNGGCDGEGNGTINVGLPDNLLGNTVTGGNYELLGYQYDDVDSIGTFLLQGKNTQESATSRIEVSINIVDREKIIPETFPGLFMEDIISLGGNDISASAVDPSNIMCSFCRIEDVEAGCVDGVPIPEAIHTDAMGANSGSTLTNVTAILGDPDLPSVPTPPSADKVNNLGCISNQNNIEDLPRTGDILNNDAIGGPAYEYTASCLNVGSRQMIVTTDGSSAVVNDNYPVHIYLVGNNAYMTVTGNGTVLHNGVFGDFAIFGQVDDGTVATHQEIKLNGNGEANYFIFAPDAEVGINGGGSDPCDMEGVVWAEVWEASSSNTADICIPAGAQQALANAFPSLNVMEISLKTRTFQHSAITTWERKEAN